ncbi:hypothetical protein GCM10027280_18360 [Micromonospora polyrhachis]|uniref:Uncharacterized protein n=1 Tax=Micromonospora polyrhachis TaxID=1282883 RepID=A0A7W7SLD9_9ACTN|nr:hypothetical protein [Micromonospora polyrhachis]MBB4956933.1 hypothetical protein [Micromonospora polyrhachis]
MSDIERGSDKQDADLDEFAEDWAEPDEPQSRWSRLKRAGLRRPATPLLAAVCVGVLVVLIGVVVGTQTRDDTGSPSNAAGADPTVEPPPIDFVPVGEEGEVTPTPSASTSPTGSPSAGTSASPTASSPPPSGSPTRTPQQTPGSTAPKVTFAAVGGYNCTHTSTRGFRIIGRYSEDKQGWVRVGSGAWTADGCDGSFDTMPMSGSKTKDDSSFYAEWWFAVGTGTRSCAVSTYVPTTTVHRHVAGKPATYQVRDTEGGAVRATFTVDQRVNRGRWVSAGTYAVSGGRIVIRGVNRGEDWNDDGRTYEHVAVAQLRVTCQ